MGLFLVCPECKAKVPIQAKACPQCGTNLQNLPKERVIYFSGQLAEAPPVPPAEPTAPPAPSVTAEAAPPMDMPAESPEPPEQPEPEKKEPEKKETKKKKRAPKKTK